MSYEFTKLSEVPAVSEFPQGANTIIEANGEIKRCPPSNTPKPLTYDYMPEGYPKKAMGTVTVMEEQAVEFYDDKGSLERYGDPANPFNIIEGQTYTVNWDRTEYVCVCSIGSEGGVSLPYIGNMSIGGLGDDTGEPFLYTTAGLFVTLDTSATHTISVKGIQETVTPLAEEFLPAGMGTTVFYL